MGEVGHFLFADNDKVLQLGGLVMVLLAASVGEVLGGAATTFVIGFTVVFMVLLLLTGVFKVFGMIMSLKEKKQDAPSIPNIPVMTSAPVASAPVVGNTETVSSQPDVDGGVPAETVAAISAAVASVAPEGTQYAVRGIKKL